MKVMNKVVITEVSIFSLSNCDWKKILAFLKSSENKRLSVASNFSIVQRNFISLMLLGKYFSESYIKRNESVITQ